MKFGQMITRSQPDLVISPRYDAWMRTNSNPVYSARALEFMHRQLTTPGRKRRGTFSSSSMASCARRQVFTFLGLPQIPPDPKLSAIFQNGQFMHLRWQMAGLSEGFLNSAEIAVPENRYKLSGTIDGLADDASLVEFKSINSNGFSEVHTFGPKAAHEMQLGTYMLVSGVTKGRFIYENKDTQEYLEIPMVLKPDLVEEIEIRADWLWDRVDQQELPEPLHKCVEKTGYEYHGCPFRDRCLHIQNWKGATLHV
jgi:hypothetical protein